MKVTEAYSRGPRLFSLYSISFSGALIAVIYYFSSMAALILLFIWLALILVYRQVEARYQLNMEDYMMTMDRRLKRSEHHALTMLPIGVIVIDSEGDIAWFNKCVTESIGLEVSLGENFNKIWAGDLGLLDKENQLASEKNVKIKDKLYHTQYVKEEGILYITDETLRHELETKLKDTNMVIGMLHLDNFYEMSKELSEHDASLILAENMTVIFEWAHSNQILIKRIQQESYLLIFEHARLEELEKERFSILDDVKKLDNKTDMLMTVSIGIVADMEESIVRKGQLAQKSLDIALARGGDQVAIRRGEKITYFGGRSDAIEKRTKVRARVMAHSLRELIIASDTVYVMPHTNPDPDAIGSALGALTIVQHVGKQGYIVLDKSNPSIRKIVKYLKEHGMGQYIIKPEQALENIRSKSLLICVDHNKPELSMDARLLKKTSQIVVIDHHRRSQDMIDKPSLLYIEPYASSTCELISELIEYQYSPIRLSQIIATILMAGIVVDTKNFSFHTGARTFEAASFLRREGADNTIMQKLLADDFDLFIERSEIVRNAERYENGIAIAKARTSDKYGTVVIAQAANTLVTLEGIRAAFVLQEVDYGIAISARSQGEVNVQLIMEQLGGGGHLTTAAAQMKGHTPEEAEEKLKVVLRKLKEEGSL